MQLLIDSIALILSAVICYSIWRAVRGGGTAGVLALAAAGLMFGLHLIASSYPALWLSIVPHPVAVVLSVALGWMAAPVILYGLSMRAGKRRDRRALGLLSACVGLYAAWMVGASLTPVPPGGEEARLNGVLLQNSDYTCVAASAVNYLEQYGYHLTEDEAVLRGLIGINGGDDLNAWRILRLTLPDDYSVRAGKVNPRRMLSDRRWYMVPIRLEMNIGHEVLVRREPDGRTVTVRDPISGESTMLWKEFESVWLGTAVWVESSSYAPLRISARTKR